MPDEEVQQEVILAGVEERKEGPEPENGKPAQPTLLEQGPAVHWCAWGLRRAAGGFPPGRQRALSRNPIRQFAIRNRQIAVPASFPFPGGGAGRGGSRFEDPSTGWKLVATSGQGGDALG